MVLYFTGRFPPPAVYSCISVQPCLVYTELTKPLVELNIALNRYRRTETCCMSGLPHHSTSCFRPGRNENSAKEITYALLCKHLAYFPLAPKKFDIFLVISLWFPLYLFYCVLLL